MVQSLYYAVGLVCGLIFAFTFAFVWIGTAGPLQEWICEVTLDRWHRLRKGPPVQPIAPEEGSVSVLFSDVHMDTWDPNSDRPRAFLEFIKWIAKEPTVTDVYINGDIFDMPPHPLNQKDVPTLTVEYGRPIKRYPDVQPGTPLGVLQKAYDRPLELINALSNRSPELPPLEVTYLTGNHDIGIEGLRYIRPDLTWSSVKVAWNPSVLLKVSPDRWVYVEHGHRYDPFLWLYLRYAIMQLFRGPTAVRIAQRSGKVGMKKVVPLTHLQANLAAPLPWENQAEIQPTPQEGVGTWIARYRFRQAARRTFRRIRNDYGDQVKVVTFGHTHIPDRYEFPDDRLYVNSGDWASNSPDQTYLIIHANAAITGPIQWKG